MVAAVGVGWRSIRYVSVTRFLLPNGRSIDLRTVMTTSSGFAGEEGYLENGHADERLPGQVQIGFEDGTDQVVRFATLAAAVAWKTAVHTLCCLARGHYDRNRLDELASVHVGMCAAHDMTITEAEAKKTILQMWYDHREDEFCNDEACEWMATYYPRPNKLVARMVKALA